MVEGDLKFLFVYKLC